MKLNNVAHPEKNTAELEFVIDKASFDAAVNEVYRKKVRNITINGFRKGKAPKHVIERMYGTGFFYEDAINDLLPEAYEAALAESKQNAVGRPEIDIVAIDDNGVTIKAVVAIYPTDLTVKEYKGLSAEKDKKNATVADVNAEIEKIRARNARMIEITDRAAKIDDIALIDYDGYVNGVAFEGGKAEKHELKLGSGQFIPGFEDQIVGHNAGDEFDVNVTFPEGYHAKELSGKPAVFKVKLHAIRFNELPELDDEFAKDVSEFDTLDEYKASIKSKIQERYNAESDNAYAERLMDALIANLDGDIPEVMYETEIDNMINDYDMRLRQNGMDLNTYCNYLGLKIEDMRKDFRAQAERSVKCRLALEKVAELEKIEVSEDDVNAELDKLAKAYNMELDKIKASVPTDIVTKDIALQKALEVVKSSATVIKKTAAKKTAAAKKTDDESEGEKAAPAKKTTTAKKTAAKTEAAAETVAAKKPAAKKTAKKADDSDSASK